MQSRYYNPEIGRFINADALVSTGQGITGYNMFAYCGNNPVIYFDMTGTRYCAAGALNEENIYDRFYSCYWQRQVVLEKYNPAPIGRTDLGNVYLVESEDEIKTEFPGDIVIIDYRNDNDYNLSRVQIRNSVLVKDKHIQRQVLSLLNQYELSYPSKWERNTDIEDMLIEWVAHNHIFVARRNVRCQHVDIDNKDKGVSYWDYWGRAIYETVF